MKRNANQFILSPSDLVRYMHSLFVFRMLRLGLELSKMRQFKDKPDVLSMQLSGRGLQHELDYLETFEQSSKTVLTIKDAFKNPEKSIQTEKVMNACLDLFFKTFSNSNTNHFQDHANFLVNSESSATLHIKIKTGEICPIALEYQFDTSQEFRDHRFTSFNILATGLNNVSIEKVETVKESVYINHSANKTVPLNFLVINLSIFLWPFMHSHSFNI